MNSSADLNLDLRRQVPLADWTTMKTGGPADYWVQPKTEEELRQALELARQERIPFLIMGKGSNLIFPDAGYRGLVINMAHYGRDLLEADIRKATVRASCGTQLYALAAFCRDHGLAGAEFLATIPGTLGGALVMNAGFSRFAGQLNQIGDLVEEVRVMEAEGECRLLPKSSLEFSYRNSSLKGQILLDATLRLWKRPPQVIDEEIRLCLKYRKKTQNIRFPSSGSIFKNPPAPLPKVAKLIDELGLKGERRGDIMISQEHANYFINVGRGKSSDVMELIEYVQDKIFQARGIRVETEVKIIRDS